MVKYIGVHDWFCASGICIRLENNKTAQVLGVSGIGWKQLSHKEAAICVRAGNIFKDLLVEVKDLG